MTTVAATHPQAEQIATALERHLNEGLPFTAYEITKEVRKAVGRQVNVPHAEVKEIVHAAFHQGLFDHLGYGRILANLPGVEVQPWVYHLPGADLTKYGLGKPLMQVLDYDDQPGDPAPSPSIPVPVLPALAPPVMTVVDSDAADDGGAWERSVDARESLSIPATLLKEVGCKPGDTVFVYANPLGGDVIVSSYSVNDSNLVFLKSYTVNVHTNVRITRATLNDAGLPGKDFKVEKDEVSNSIVVTAR